MLEGVRSAIDLDAGKRAELVDKLQTVLKETRYQASIKEELDRQRNQQQAAIRERKLLNEQLQRRIDREDQLMDRFEALMDESRYIEAQEVALVVDELDPDGVTARSALINARARRNHYLKQVVRAARWTGFFNAMYQTELSSVPMPDEPPIVYPEAEVWEELSNRRKAKYSSMDLSASSSAEENINNALRGPLNPSGLQFVEEPLNNVIDVIKEEYDIPIMFDEAALEELGITSDTEVTINLRNVSLRSALNHLLSRSPGLEDLTYVIDDEVLLITTEDRANETLTVKVYP